MQLDPATYDQQLASKVANMSELFAEFSGPTLKVFDSPRAHYRMRAEFRVWHDGDDLYHIMFDQETKQKKRVDQFLPASESINKAMTNLMKLLRDNAVLRKKLFQIDYLNSLSNELVISLLYHRQLDEEWQNEAEILRETLSRDLPVSIIGRARKQKIIIGNDFVIERLPIKGKEYVFKHIENSFTQPNAEVNCKMIEWTLDATKSASGDLVEFYCGAGNFSLPLAQNFNRVVGTEIAKPSVEAAQYNIAANQLNNVEIVRLAAEEFTQAMRGERSFTRLGAIDLTHYDFNTVLVDPPRSGLDSETLALIAQFDTIIYISCNPVTLKDNLEQLIESHQIDDFALFDQFPYTDHIESGVLLRKK
ncbi:tRNA (uridine(54)-C5)-methyltransferase TrmA [Alteromonas sp. ASW11-36]|uniref:tRNA/tmRNA (uracil-C(5))-methyltransferase n=1 Tax=Alteromonas arenosi TaxID=3055817 RepID=A0ABT7T0T5_9ALTE|nr:tRNA (uridine(54)-C5)-methyltransferase TrmA [Alteromonas sp. ASW11-36]MDM7861422.1 tRNA (uridine(54)-C5)-methyltransferase TrmA [Alteromonas sp. ASW11-36]